MAAVSMRYAEALLNSADNKLKVGEYLESISNIYVNDAEFREMMNNPRVKKDVKLDIIKEIAEKDKTFINFIELVLEEGRFNLINDMCVKYMDMINEMNNIVSIVIVSALELTDEEALAIASKYKKLYDANEVKYEVKVDSSLIGGVKVFAGGKVYDDTIRTKLDEIL